MIEMMARYDMVPRYLDTEAYRKAVEELISGEQAAFGQDRPRQTGLKRSSARAGRRQCHGERAERKETGETSSAV